MIDKQITFDTVVTGLRKQKDRSVGENGSCVFRSPNGNKCAVGMLVPDDLYDPLFDNPKSEKCIWDLDVMKEHDRDLCSALMIVHDQKAIEDWEKQFEGVAVRFGLVYIPPEK
jgi:hypothetical protein